VAGVEAWQVAEAPLGAKVAIGRENMDMGVEVEQLADGLEETHSAGCHLSAVEGHLEVEPEGSPGTSGELTQRQAVVAEEEAQALGDSKYDLPVGDILDELFLGPDLPQTRVGFRLAKRLENEWIYAVDVLLSEMARPLPFHRGPQWVGLHSPRRCSG